MNKDANTEDMWNVSKFIFEFQSSTNRWHSLCSSVGQSEGLLIPRSSVRARSQAHSAFIIWALLAQLVARGSDKAKVIGSSPVESMSCIFVDFCVQPNTYMVSKKSWYA